MLYICDRWYIFLLYLYVRVIDFCCIYVLGVYIAVVFMC